MSECGHLRKGDRRMLKALFAALVFLEWLVRSRQPPQEPRQQQPACKYPNDQTKCEERKSFWQRTKTDPIALYTLVLAIFTGLLALVAVFQIILMFRAETTSTKAADAAEKAANVAERALIAGQRAFVAFVTLNHVPSIKYKTNQMMQWSFAPIWKNAGSTPTRGMTAHVSIRIFDGELPKDWDFPDIWSQALQEPVPLGISPQSSISGDAIPVSLEAVDDVIARKKSLYMWGWAAYSDVFPDTKRHITRFAVQIEISGNARDINHVSFVDRFIRKYNCSDEECDSQGYPASWVARSLAY